MPIFSGMPPEFEDELALELPEELVAEWLELLQDASTRAASPSPLSKTANDFMISPLAQHGITQWSGDHMLVRSKRLSHWSR
jgi:hypothetical protein